MDYFENIYDSLQGLLIKETAIPWVENAFAPGSLCQREYVAMREAYERLCTRLGVDVDDGDGDLNTMVDSLESIQRELCRKMFLYGMEYERMR